MVTEYPAPSHAAAMPLHIRQEGPVRIAPVTVQKAGDPSTAVKATAVEVPVKKPQAPAPRREDPTLSSLANPRRIVNEIPMPTIAQIAAPPPKFGEGIPGPRRLDEITDDEGSESYTDEGSSQDVSGSESEDTGGRRGDDQPFESMAGRAERIRAEKTDLLNKLYDYARKGEVVPEHLGLRSTVDELREAVERIRHSVAKRASVKFQGRMLVTVATGLELLNNTLDVVGPDLDGWSHTVMTEVTDYETAFEQLHDLYGGRIDCHPLIQIMFMLALSGWNHMSFAKKRRDDGDAQRQQPRGPETAPPPRPQPPQASRPVPPNRMSAASTQSGPGSDPIPKPGLAPPPAPAPTAPPPAPAAPFNAAAGASAPPSNPYVMKGPSGLGVLPGFSPAGFGRATGPAMTPAQFPPSADLIISTQVPEMVVPPRPEPVRIVEVADPKPPKRGRPKKNGDDAASEAGVQI